jgi:formylglycine-generating enzyme required for sulfatase activity
VQFTLSWENSWRDIVNWDAVWVFIKYKRNDGVWRHATLSVSGHVVPGSAAVYVPSDGKGAFIYRSANGSGTNSFSGVQLKWEYGADAVGDNELVTVKVFGIEMVYVPECAFWVGDGANPLYSHFRQGGTNLPYKIVSENEITLGGTSASNLTVGANSSGDDFNATTLKTLPAAYPKGYRAFYCMKYEASQGQYADFLNTLSSAQAAARFDTSTDYRNTVTLIGSTYSASRPDRAFSSLSIQDWVAYADWSALRPMTELEYEKACRGDQYPVTGEFAWGTTNIAPATTIIGAENGTETVNADANCRYASYSGTLIGGDGGFGPLRCGIFAKNSTTREMAGASYYGIMELSGNAAELIMSFNNATRRAFTGLHGDGELTAAGDYDVNSWSALGDLPQDRGGNYSFGGWYLTVSFRTTNGWRNPDIKRDEFGIRCVRSIDAAKSNFDGNNLNNQNRTN